MTGQGYTPIIPSLRRLRQEECKIKASMSYIARCCPRKLNKCHYSSDSQAPGLFYATRAGLSTIFYKLQDFFSPIINGSHCCLWSSWLETETPVLAIIINNNNNNKQMEAIQKLNFLYSWRTLYSQD
jgi:hypothetical protein